MRDGVYLETLRLGFENPNGISFNQIVKELNIDLSDISFRTNYTIWFYSSFYNRGTERLATGNRIAINTAYKISEHNINEIEKHNDTKSYIKGDAINKYIDFLELERTRKSSTIATRIALISIVIAISSIVIPIMYSHNPKPPYEVIITNDRNNTTNSKFDNSLNCKSGIKDMDNNKASGVDTLDVINPKQ